jgi:hypothetical protein
MMCLIFCLTEGVFKALAGCSNGIPTISLLGVEQGLTGKARDPENQRFLVPALRKLAEAGFGFIIAFDADAATNPNVAAAERNWLSNWLNSMCSEKCHRRMGSGPERGIQRDG